MQSTLPYRPLHIVDIVRHWANATPRSPAIWEGGAPLSFAELWSLTGEGVDWLRQRGVQRGDRVMLVAENCSAEIAFLFAASAVGAWPVVVNARMSAREIEAIRAHCMPRVMIFTSGFSADAARHAARHQAIPISHADFAALAASAVDQSALPECNERASEVAALIYTSGTTGAPKGVMVTHRGLLHFCGVSASSRKMTPSDRVYAVLPISHIFGIATVVLATLAAGASIFIESRFEAASAYDSLAQFEISILQGVPLLFRRLLTHRREASGLPALPKLRYLYIGGGALEPALKAEVESAFGLPLNHGYGMTEYAGSMFITPMDQPRTDCSSGKINLGCEARIVDTQGGDAPSGDTGEIWVRGPGTMLGYYRSEALTREVLTGDGWLKTGDLGRFGEDGALFVVGRNKDVIKRAGFNVYPIEVESVLNSHPAVKLSAVVGRPLQDGDEEVVAFVEREQGASLDVAELNALAHAQLAPYKRPARIIEVTALPVNANGKVLKQQLRAQSSLGGSGPS